MRVRPNHDHMCVPSFGLTTDEADLQRTYLCQGTRVPGFYQVTPKVLRRRRATQRMFGQTQPVDRNEKSHPAASPRTYQPGRTSPALDQGPSHRGTKSHDKTAAGGWSARPGVARPIAEPIALWRMTERLIASPPCRGEANGAAFVVLRDPSRVRMAFDPTMPARVRPERQLRERVSPLDRSKSPVFLIASHGA